MHPTSQVEQITIALIYKFMFDMDKDALDFGGQETFGQEPGNNSIHFQFYSFLNNLNPVFRNNFNILKETWLQIIKVSLFPYIRILHCPGMLQEAELAFNS